MNIHNWGKTWKKYTHIPDYLIKQQKSQQLQSRQNI